VVDLSTLAGLPPAALPAATGVPLGPQFVPCRFTGDAADSLLLVCGKELLMISPARSRTRRKG
jgi:hypothetical protein